MPAWSGLFDNVFADGPHSLQFNRPSARRNVARLFRKRGMRQFRELIIELTGSAPGNAALQQNTRVTHDADNLGGVRTVEVQDLINRVTTSADATDIDTELVLSATAIAPASYPVDAGGAGGGGKLGY